MSRTGLSRAALGALAALILSGCAVNGLSFVQDDRVDVVRPDDGATISLPAEIAWTAREFDGYFAIFFDRSPMKPGQSLQSLVPDRDPCRSQEVCPDANWLADHDIYVTDQTSLVVELLPDQRASGRSKDRHELTIVLLDSRGRRLGESAFTKEFIVERED